MWREYGPTPWPGLIYPSGTFEVHFKPMSARPPFDDVALRDEFRQRLNQAPGVDIPQVKLALYPSFRLSVLADSRAYSAVLDALRWFAAQLDA
jgi:hypothetical protein